MNKRIIAIITIASLFLACGIPSKVKAANEPNPTTPPETVYYDNDGNEYTVETRIISKDIAVLNSDIDDEKAMTCEYILTPRGTGSTSEDAKDKNAVLHAYLTIKYTTGSTDGIPSILLTQVTGYWTVLDSSASVTNSTISCACVDLNPKTQSQHATMSSTGNNFTFTPRFTTYAQIAGLGVYTIGAEWTLSIKKGSNTWTLYLKCDYI